MMIPTVVKDDVSIGSGAAILPGVTITSGLMVGSVAVVTGDMEPFSLVVGLPGRRISEFSDKYLFEDID